jgi:hypothetical protein
MRTTIRSLLVVMLFSATTMFAGAWGPGSFENDDALDWVQNHLKPRGQRAVDEAIRSVVENSVYLQAPSCSRAIAACEVIAAAQGRGSDGTPKEIVFLASKLPAKQADGLRSNARRALDKILANSELKDLWSDSRAYDKWKAAMVELKGRI